MINFKRNISTVHSEQPIESSPEFEGLIDHIGNLLAEEYFHRMEESDIRESDDEEK